MLSERYWTFWWGSHLKYLLFFSICYYYYYYYYYFIASWRWFLTYTYPIFVNKFFGFSSLEFFIESLYASNIFHSFFSFYYFFSFMFLFNKYIYIYIYIVCLFIIIIIIIVIIYVYVSSTCTGLAEKRIRFTLKVWVLFGTCILEFFYSFIIEWWVLVNLKYRKIFFTTRFCYQI